MAFTKQARNPHEILATINAQQMSFPLRFTSHADLVTFNEEILIGKLHFLCSVCKSCNTFAPK